MTCAVPHPTLLPLVSAKMSSTTATMSWKTDITSIRAPGWYSTFSFGVKKNDSGESGSAIIASIQKHHLQSACVRHPPTIVPITFASPPVAQKMPSAFACDSISVYICVMSLIADGMVTDAPTPENDLSTISPMALSTNGATSDRMPRTAKPVVKIIRGENLSLRSPAKRRNEANATR